MHPTRKRPRVVVAVGSRTSEVATALRLSGVDAREARSGLDAVSLLFPRGDDRSHEPHAMVLSSVLPGYNGLSVLAGIRSLGWRTPVVMLFPNKSDWMLKEAGRLACNRLLREPVGTQEVCAALLSCLEMSESLVPNPTAIPAVIKGRADA